MTTWFGMPDGGSGAWVRMALSLHVDAGLVAVFENLLDGDPGASGDLFGRHVGVGVELDGALLIW